MISSSIDQIERDIKHMTVSDVRVSVEVVSGEICIDEITLRDARGNKADLIVDEWGNLKAYPQSKSENVRALTLDTWGE